ncbi:MAG: hypothetical protein PF485_14955 [Bacteroidales bacterium]|nr:hypothetical protein [Bacteroidales bacterium]
MESISTEEWFKYKGGLNLNSTAYNAVGMDSRRDPFFWGIDANLNFTLFNIVNVPLSAHYSKDNNTFSHPTYNYFGLSPSYKYITVHAGYRNMQFSSYSLSGLTFLGAGVEINPENSLVKFSAMYGRLNKAVPYKIDSGYVASANPFNVVGYERWAYGGKLTVGREKHSVDLILFKAKDDVNSIPDPGEESGIKPQENLVIGFNTRNQLTEKISLQLEYSLSAFSRDIRVAERKMETFTYVNNVGDLFTPRYSTSINSAYSANLSYAGETFSAGIVFKHIDPEYQSLGTTYMSNDVENVYFNLKKSFFKNGLSFSGNIGQERNNLSNTMDATDKRVIGSANCNISLLNPLNISLSYSNFNANSLPVATTMQDTFKYVQVTENYGINASYQLSGEKFTHSFSLNSMVQTMNTLNQNATTITDINTDVYNMGFGYSLYWIKLKLNLMSSINYNNFQPGEGLAETTGIGPSVGLSKGFLKNKMQTSLMYTYQNNKTTGTNESKMNVLRFNGSYKVTSHQSLRLSFSMMFRTNDNYEEIKKQEEYNARLTYSYSF